MNSSFLEAKKALIAFKGLSELELLVAGICVGITKVSAEVVLRFLNDLNKLSPNYLDKEKYLNFVCQGHLGKVKEFSKGIKRVGNFYKAQNPCGICKLDVNTEQIEFADECNYIFHRTCLKTNLEQQLTIKTYPIHCPSCSQELKYDSLKSKVEKHLLEKYNEKMVNQAINSSDLLPSDPLPPKPEIPHFNCPIETCKKLLIPTKQHQLLLCKSCKNFICCKCKSKAHDGPCRDPQPRPAVPIVPLSKPVKKPEEPDKANTGQLPNSACTTCGKNKMFCGHGKIS